MVKFEISPKNTCLLIIDTTNAFLKPGAPMEVPDGRHLIPKLKRLMDVCREKDLMIIFTTHAYRQNGCDMGLHAAFRPEIETMGILREGKPDTEFYDELRPAKNDIVIVKRRYSAFIGTELDLILRCNKIDTLMISGVLTHVCCECTARDARMRDYKVIFLSDGTADRGIADMGWGEISAGEVQKYVLTIMASHFAEVLPVDEVISRLNS